MDRALVFRAGGILVCLLTIATTSFSQASPGPSPSATPDPSPLRIIYSGKSFGYFRVPNLQSVNDIRVCRDQLGGSKAANGFLSGPQDRDQQKQSEQQEKYRDSIRVSTGDNFAPQLEAREFSAPEVPNPAKYRPGNKELYSWYNGHWVIPDDDLSPQAQDDLRAEAAKGTTTIPTDNVACFLAAAHYAAIVPGRHDFYFGAERLRLLARFMAGIHEPNYQPVQMLGANLVIKTSRIAAAPAAPNKSKWPDDSSVQNLREGKPVYPWFASLVRVKVPAPAQEKVQGALKFWFDNNASAKRVNVEKFLDEKVNGSSADEKSDWTNLRDAVKHLESVYICPANDVNEITKACDHGWEVEEKGITGDETGITYSISILRNPAKRSGGNGHYLTFEPGKTYGLCQRDRNSKASQDEIEKACMSFPVYTPLFYFPRSAPLIESNDTYPGPDPFVLIPSKSTPERDVAIFGVVDPSIGEQVGILNFSWLNENPRLKTTVSAEEPAEALKEQLEYFNVWYENRAHHKFQGLKILLAQMSPQRARVLAARLPGFQIVVTAADEEQGTSETTLTTEWSKKTKAGALVAVPIPYVKVKQPTEVEGTVHFGMIEASNNDEGWRLEGTPLNQAEIPLEAGRHDKFGDLVSKKLQECLPDEFSYKADKQEDVKLLTLCAMRERLGADVALIQKRDFFDKLPKEAGDAPDDVQRILDRTIWKGDLLALLYVPGSAIKKALDQSKKYDDEDSNSLSLADERQRAFLSVGVKKGDREYLINEAPLDEKKIYAVATTDYIAAGDTGYPDLATFSLNPKTLPAQFPDKLISISGLVCRKLYPEDAEARCLPDLLTGSYLDSSAAQAPASRPLGFASKLQNLFPFKLPSKNSVPKTSSAALEQSVQHHPFWTLSLRNFSVSFLSLTNNLTDAQVSQKFAGVSTSGVNAKRTRNVALGLDTRLSRSSHRNEFFAALGIDYNEQSTGDVNPKISQLKNRLTGDVGLIENIRGGRSKDRVGIAFALHAEAPLQRPFTTFTLGTQDTLKITQNRSVLLLPRIGLRWQNGANFFEVGGQVGREIEALSGYRFNTHGTIVECLPKATETFGACITRLSKPPLTAITKDSVASEILQSHPRAGLYWKYGLSIPFSAKVKYELNQEENQEADFFFNFSRDNATDTRFLDRSKHSLKFIIWPSFSIGPTLRLLLYRNKINGDLLFQKQFGFEANFSFNLSNHREKGVQLKHKP